MNKSPLISCIIPTYNREKFITESIFSVLNQTYKNIELIIIDDRSTDNTALIINDIILKNPKVEIKYYQNSFAQGPAGARNYGITKISQNSNYIAFLDSDDLWKNEYLEAIIEHLILCEADWVFSDLEQRKNGIVIVKSYYNDLRKEFSRVNKTLIAKDFYLINDKRLFNKFIRDQFPVLFQTSIVKSEVFKKYKIDEELKVCEDRLFVMNAILNNIKFGFLNKNLAIYNIHDENISNCNSKFNDQEKQLFIAGQMEVFIFKTLELNKLSKSNKKALFYKLSSYYYSYFGHIAFKSHQDYKNSLIYFLKALKINPLNPVYIKSFILTAIQYLFQKMNIWVS